MNKLLVAVATILTLFTISCEDIYTLMWNNASDDVRRSFPIEVQAYSCGMTEAEFEYLARVVEAESDRTDNLDGKILIAAVVLNRVNSSSFPNTIDGVLNESGQFSTTNGGWCSECYTISSRWAIVEAQRQLASGDIPDNLLYFNCIGYNYGTAYGYVDGNYFMCA